MIRPMTRLPSRPMLQLLLLFYLVAATALRGVYCLRLLSLDIPSSVRRDESIWLNCTLDLERDELYSVKWYKNDVEFYRFLPRDQPSGQAYDLPGVFVDLDKSQQGNVYLRTTDLNTEGLYRCEASAESPTFQTVEGEKEIKIYVLPQEDPTIQGSLPKYVIGDFVNVTCRSGPSKPAANLKWYINGKQAPSEFITSSLIIDHMDGLKTSSLGLMFFVGSGHLGHNTGSITLKCTSIVSQTYSMSSEELIVGDRLSETSSPTDGRSPLINHFSPRDGPIISGGKMHYRVGETLNVNCSSYKSRDAPELQWFINDIEVPQLHLIRYLKRTYTDGQETTTLGLRFTVSSMHFDDQDEMRLKCTATLSEVINMRSEERTLGGNHRSSWLHASETPGIVSDRDSATNSSTRSVISFVLLFLTLLGHLR